MKFGVKHIAFAVILIILAAGAVGILKTSGIFFRGTGASSARALYYCPMHPAFTSDRPGKCAICGMQLVKRETDGLEVHRREDPAESGVSADAPRVLSLEELMAMKPGEICLLHKCKMGTCMIAMTEEFARLGKCPHCGEDLGVVIKEMAPGGYESVRLEPEKQRLIGIQTSPAKRMAVSKTLRTSGRIAYDPELYQAQEEYLQAVEAMKKAEGGEILQIKEQARKLVDAAKTKLRLLGLSDALIEEVQAAGKPDRSLLYSEAGGTVWLYAPIYEYEIPYVRVGDEIEIEIPSIPGKKIRGTIRSIDPVLDPMTRSVRVRASLQNPEGILKPEMYVNASLSSGLGEVLVVPEEAVFDTGTRRIVFVAKEGHVFEPREVMTGAKTEGYYEIKSGISEGENVVTSGNFLIDSESRLKAALEGLGGGGGGHQHGG